VAINFSSVSKVSGRATGKLGDKIKAHFFFFVLQANQINTC
jgi:hypothetical protein